MSDTTSYAPRTSNGPLRSIDLLRVREHAVYLVTVEGGAEYRVTRDTSPEDKRINSGQAHVLVTMAPFGGDIKVNETPMRTHSVIEVGRPWHTSEDAEGNLEFTKPVASIALLAEIA